MKLMRWTPSERQRKFGRDVGSVVLGVLIALGIGEIAEAIRWQVRASVARDAIEAELARDAGVMAERVLVQPCADRRLDQLKILVNAARQSGELPLVGPIGRTTSRPIEQAAWTLTSGSETLLHIRNPPRQSLALLHSQMAGYYDRVREERQMWATLKLMEDSKGAIGDDMLVEVAGTLNRLSELAETNGLVAEQILAQIQDFGIEQSNFIVLDREGDATELAARVNELTICKPLMVEGRPMN